MVMPRKLGTSFMSNCQRFGFGGGADFHGVSGDSVVQKGVAKKLLLDLLNLHFSRF